MTTHSISAGKEHYNSTNVEQRKLGPYWPLYILVACGDSSSHACSAIRKASTHTGILSLVAMQYRPFMLEAWNYK
eukprot:13011457-Ditylum_brightwellii.AAC.1